MGTTNGIITAGRIKRIGTIPIALADVIRAHIVIVTDIGRARTNTIGAGVRMGARHGVITGGRVEGEVAGSVAIGVETTRLHIIRTDVSVITGIGGTHTGTRPITSVRMCVPQAVITRSRVEGVVAGPVAVGVETTRLHIIRTDVTVITGIGGTHAGARPITGVRMCVPQAVITWSRVEGEVAGSIAVGVETTRLHIIRTDVTVIAGIGGTHTGARPITGVRMCIIQAVITGSRVEGEVAGSIAVGVETTRANIIGTDVTVIAGIGGTHAIACAIAGVAMGITQIVITGSRIEGVIAGSVTVFVHAARTFVIGTDIAIITAIEGA